MTRPIVHVWRLLRWGRVLARHGALRGIERNPNTPAPVRRLASPDVRHVDARVRAHEAVPRPGDDEPALGHAHDLRRLAEDELHLARILPPAFRPLDRFPTGFDRCQLDHPPLGL